MALPTSRPAADNRTADVPVFQHVLVGIDAMPESVVAAAQTRVLRAPDSRVRLLAVAETYLAAQAGMAAPFADDDLFNGTTAALERARELVESDDSHLASGRLVDLLSAECKRGDVTLVVVGVRPHRRLTALTFGGHDVEVLHDVPCSVLIARPGWGPAKPQRIVVGIDGSPEARTAEAVARSLAERIGCPVVPVVGLADDIDVDVLRAERDDAVLDPRGALEAVAGMSGTGDLVVVARGRERAHRWGGDVAERAVYAAKCSVLVVRDPDV
jgi:nucleotide-binding universal stress UspA family protein